MEELFKYIELNKRVFGCEPSINKLKMTYSANVMSYGLYSKDFFNKVLFIRLNLPNFYPASENSSFVGSFGYDDIDKTLLKSITATSTASYGTGICSSIKLTIRGKKNGNSVYNDVYLFGNSVIFPLRYLITLHDVLLLDFVEKLECTYLDVKKMASANTFKVAIPEIYVLDYPQNVILW